MIYIDVDGVMADFEQSVYDIDNSFTPEDFRSSKKLYDLMIDNYKICYRYSPKARYFDFFFDMYNNSRNVMFLTACGIHWKTEEQDQTVRENKLLWLEERGIDRDDVIIVGHSKDKLAYCTSAESVLYDDRMSTIEAWNKKGGVGFLVYNHLNYNKGYY